MGAGRSTGCRTLLFLITTNLERTATSHLDDAHLFATPAADITFARLYPAIIYFLLDFISSRFFAATATTIRFVPAALLFTSPLLASTPLASDRSPTDSSFFFLFNGFTTSSTTCTSR